MTARILQGDCLDLLPTLAPGSVDVCITSPPYWLLRDYQTGTWEGGDGSACDHVQEQRPPIPGSSSTLGVPAGGGKQRIGENNSTHERARKQYRDTCGKCGARRVDKQLGLEATPEAFIQRLVEVFRLVRTAMSDTAVAWVNIGDTYSTGPAGNVADPMAASTLGGRRPYRGDPADETASHANLVARAMDKAKGSGLPAGNLALIPQRLALALQADGWVVRSVVVWRKPSPMPMSLSGWKWYRCRVKLRSCRASSSKGQWNGLANEAVAQGRNPDSSRNPELQTQWADCPGCNRCRDNGGLVLRRGSWRPTSSWEPILMLAKQSGYYGDGIPVQTALAAATVSRDQYSRVIDNPDEQYAARHDHETVCDGGANLRDVWQVPLADLSKDELIELVREMQDGSLQDVFDIPAEPLSTHWCPKCMKFYDGAPPGRLCRRCKVKLESHYASFPTELVYRCLASSTSAKGYCPQCSAPWARVVETKFHEDSRPHNGKGGIKGLDASNGWSETPRGTTEATTLGWRATCPHSDLPPRPAVVLDPFAGSSRVGIQTVRMGLDFVGIELSPGYVALGRHLLGQAMPLFAEE